MTPSAATAAARKPAARAKPAVQANPAAAQAKPAARASVKPKAPSRPAAKASARAPSRTSPRPARGRSRGGRATIARGSRSYRRASGPAPTRMAERALPALPALPSLPRLPRISLPQLRPVPVLGVLGVRAYRAGRALPESRLLDRLMRGRIWIGLLAVLLLGLVFLNVSLLKLNSEAGRNANRVKALRIENDRLHAKVSRLQGGNRLERVAGRLGLVMPEPGNVHYMSVSEGDATRAARALRAGRRAPADGSLEGTVPTSPASGPALPAPAIAPTPAAPAAAAPGLAPAAPDTAAATPAAVPAAPPAATPQGPTGQTAPVPAG